MLSAIIALVPMLLPFICIILIAISYALIFKKKLLQTYFLSIATIIFILFLCGILNFDGSLLLGYAIVIAFSLFSLGFLIYTFIKNRKSISNLSLISGVLIFSLFLLLALFINYRRMFTNWDEFSHWGVVVKSMYSFDALGTYKDAVLMFKAYLPGASLFQYFWARPFPQFTEFLPLVASNVLFFSVLMSFIKKINWKTILFVITAFLIPLLMGMFFYTSLYVDCLLGILLGASLISYYYHRYEESSYGIFIVSFFLGVLTLTKDMGFVFSGIAFLIMLFDCIFFRRNSIKEYIGQKAKILIKCKKFLILLLPLIVIFAFQLLWRVHLAKIGITSPWLHSSLKETLDSIIHNNLLPYQYEVINLFKDALTNKKIYPLDYSLTTILAGIVVTSLPLILFMPKKDVTQKRIFWSFLGIIIGGILYIGILFFFYLFAMAQYESLILAGYARYILSYLIGIFFFYVIFIILENKKKSKNPTYANFFKKYSPKVVLGLVILLLYAFLLGNTAKYVKNEILNARETAHKTIEERSIYENCLVWKPYLSDPAKKPYIIAQDDYGLMKLKLMLTLYPTNIQWVWDYSVATEPYFPELNDPWTKIITPEEWGKYVIANYDLVYVFSYDQKFKNTYGKFFDNVETNALYQVTQNESGILRLVSIPVPK